MKTAFCSPVIALVASCLCLAQPSPSAEASPSISVTLGTGVSACTFPASSIMDGFTNTATIVGGPGTGGGRASASPVTIAKKVDACSIPLVLDLFDSKVIPAVTVNITGNVNGLVKPVLIITLTHALVTSLSDSDSKGDSEPTEKVTLIYGSITITDMLDNKTVTCDFVTNRCV